MVFLANSLEEELKAPDLELNQLVKIKDVTGEVKRAVKDGMSPGDAAVARRAAIEAIEKKATEESGLRSNVITLYGGGRYHLYQFKKYTDVRLVWSPESAIAFFGGDADNFEYPRYCLDACIFRVYEDDKPAKIDHYLKWSDGGAAEGELVFVAGNPGQHQSNLYRRRTETPTRCAAPVCDGFHSSSRSFAAAIQPRGRRAGSVAKDGLFGFQNARKARMGMLKGLQDPNVMAAKENAEAELLAKLKADPKLAGYASAWDQVAEIQDRRAERQGKGLSLNTQLFGIAQTLVQMAAEDKKPSSERLEEFQDSGRSSLEQQLFSSAPVYKELEKVILGDLIGRSLELRGGDDPLCRKLLDGKSPSDRAAELIDGTQLDDPEFRRSLAAGGSAAIEASQDPMIRLAAMLDDHFRAERKINDELDELERQAYAKIAEATFATQGTSTYPDATFSLRLAFGTVKGYEEDGQKIPAWTTIGGSFPHEEAHQGQQDFDLPESWHQAREKKLDSDVPFNFVCTADIIGGNSGSPVINKNLELVGLIFDGNIQSLTSDYLYDDRQGRAVSVHSEAIRHALRYVYGADELADQLGN